MHTPIRYRWVIEPVSTRSARAGAPTNGANRWVPPVDVVETDGSYVIEMDLPGVAPETVELVVEQGALVVTGERARAEGAALRRERPAGSFRRTIQLSDGIAADRIEATSTHGVLRIEVPKAETARPRRIPIVAAEAATF